MDVDPRRSASGLFAQAEFMGFDPVPLRSTDTRIRIEICLLERSPAVGAAVVGHVAIEVRRGRSGILLPSGCLSPFINVSSSLARIAVIAGGTARAGLTDFEVEGLMPRQ